MCERVQRIVLRYHREGLSSVQISRKLLREHEISFSRQAILKFVKRKNNPVSRKKPQRKVLDTHYQFLQVWLTENSDQTARELQRRFSHVFGLKISVAQVKLMRKRLNWTKTPRKYGHMVNAKNRKLRVDWCLSALSRRDTFTDVIFVDETCVEMSSSGRLVFYQRGQRMECPSLKVAKPKHPYKV